MDSPQIPYVWRQFEISKHKSTTTSVSVYYQRTAYGLYVNHVQAMGHKEGHVLCEKKIGDKTCIYTSSLNPLQFTNLLKLNIRYCT
jgi:hypothetical protein